MCSILCTVYIHVCLGIWNKFCSLTRRRNYNISIGIYRTIGKQREVTQMLEMIDTPKFNWPNFVSSGTYKVMSSTNQWQMVTLLYLS